ncbi:MAG: hypothetical protein CL609_24875 [Anaerolineaceae bacterium]|nr:hypothetical protein [Anaerolineaceae bacterium]
MFLWMRKNQNVINIIVLIVIALICFLPLSNQTGYYLNDWHPLAGKLTNKSVYSLWSFERKGVGFLFSITYPIIQDNHFMWQLFTISLRLLGAIGFYWLLNLVWKKNSYFNLSAAIIFLVYPGFMQQPIALTFSNHYIGYDLAIFSLIFSILAIKSRPLLIKIILIVVALFLQLGYLFDYEYMLGFEIVRLVLFLFLFDSPRLLAIKNLKKVLLNGALYIIGLCAFLYWRLFIFVSSRPATNIDLLKDRYINSPIDMGIKISIEIIRDFIETVWQSWSVPFYQTASNTDPKHFIISVSLAVVAVIIFILTIKFLNLENNSSPITANENNKIHYNEFIWVGLIAIFAAIIPVILSNREVKYNLQMDRYTLHATLGVALFITGLIFKWINLHSRKYILLFLLFLSVISHYNNSLTYVEWWENQRTLWWQLSWRAPDIKDGTQILPLLPFGSRLQEGAEAWAPVNAIYNPEPSEVPLITADVLNAENMVNIYLKNKSIVTFRGIQYTNDFSLPLLISYPAGGSCAHIIDGDRMELSYYDEEIIYRAAPFSQIQRIDVSASPHIPPASIFGKEPEHDWCYYYQKASLLRQQENWTEASQLGDYVLEQNIFPVDQSEWLPFLETYLILNNAEKADLIIAKIKSDTPTLENLCGVWKYEKPHLNPDVMNSLCAELPNY